MEQVSTSVPRLEGMHLAFSRDIQPGDVIPAPNNTLLTFRQKWPDGSMEFFTPDGKFVVQVSVRGVVKSVEELG